MAAAAICTSCDETLRPGWLCGDKVFLCECCGQKALCQTCFGKRPLFIHDDEERGGGDSESTPLGLDLKSGRIRRLCRDCFRSQSTLDLTAPYDYQPGTSGTTLVYLHGASGCRQMFRPHADRLHRDHGHGYLLVDLPGHGVCVDTPLTPDSTVRCIREVLTACPLGGSNRDVKDHHLTERLIYVGGSLGAYLGFHVLAELLKTDENGDVYDDAHQRPRRKYRFVGAVLMDCGQNVGPGRGLAAHVGLVFLKMIASNSSNYSMMKMMAGLSKTADYNVVECVFGAGMWFDQAAAHVECLRQVAPAALLPRIPIPVLYLNGSLDHRDSEGIWLAHSAPNSSLHVYEGGDHFFTHDCRFVDDILARIDEFEKGPCRRQEE